MHQYAQINMDKLIIRVLSKHLRHFITFSDRSFSLKNRNLLNNPLCIFKRLWETLQYKESEHFDISAITVLTETVFQKSIQTSCYKYFQFFTILSTGTIKDMNREAEIFIWLYYFKYSPNKCMFSSSVHTLGIIENFVIYHFSIYY